MTMCYELKNMIDSFLYLRLKQNKTEEDRELAKLSAGRNALSHGTSLQKGLKVGKGLARNMTGDFLIKRNGDRYME